MKFIEAETLKNIESEWLNCIHTLVRKGFYDSDIEEVLKGFCADIDKATTVNAEPLRYAHWEMSGGDICCSECGTCCYDFYGDYIPKYCPDCGAKMQEEE